MRSSALELRVVKRPTVSLNQREPRAKGRGRLMMKVKHLAIIGLLLASISAAIGWSAREVLARPQPPVESQFTLVTVSPGVVESSIVVNTVTQWPRELIALNLFAGTVTHVPASPSQTVVPGTALFEVDLSPVVVLQGRVPAFRDMSPGDVGEDIAQLQSFLQSQQLLYDHQPGVWGPETTQSVLSWQEQMGAPPTGLIPRGQIIFVPELPARISVDPEVIRVGANLLGGEEIVYELSESPSFTVPLTDAQAGSISLGTKVLITAPNDEIWDSWVVDIQRAQNESGTDLVLGGDPGAKEPTGPVCGESCDLIHTSAEGIVLRSRIIVVEETEGLVVPSAAISTNAQGETVLYDATGVEHRIHVLAGARGFSAIEGVTNGMKVQAPAELIN